MFTRIILIAGFQLTCLFIYSQGPDELSGVTSQANFSSISSKLEGSQDSTTLPPNYLSHVSKKMENISGKLDKRSEKALAQMKRQEERIRRKFLRLDSSKANKVFGDAESRYAEFNQKLDNPSSSDQYFPYLDTLKTSLKFLQNDKKLLGKVKDLDKTVSSANDKLKGLESSLAKAENLKAFIKERKDYLKQQLNGLPFATELKKINKQVYYYSASIKEFKSQLKDQKKLERKAIGLLTRSKQFQKFMRKNSRLASLFNLPDPDNPANTASLQGLQTRAQINGLIQDRIGGSADAQAIFRQNVQGARDQLSGLKEKIGNYSSGSIGNTSSDIEQPDFKVNNERTKSFLNRLEYGGNIQSQKARQYFPATSDIGLSLGYKLNDKSVIGLGASYKLGLGSGWKNIRLSNEGVGFRSFIDWKIKGSIYLSGGYEQNYRSAFNSIEQLKSLSSWQASGLIGLSKKYSISKRVRGNLQLLWDFLSYRQLPQTQALLFRIGYSLK